MVYKKHVSGNENLNLAPSAVLIFTVFHWISELVRYNPKLFSKYMKSKQNWLLHEFINNIQAQGEMAFLRWHYLKG
jgi:hypothetical protein